MYYTGKGDKGKTILFDVTKKISKKDLRIDILGTFDELNSYLGLCKALAKEGKLKNITIDIGTIQNHLFSCQAKIAGAKKDVGDDFRDFLEQKIAEMEKSIPPIKNFIITGADTLSAHFDVARTITRRLERKIVWLPKNRVQTEILPYVNRLSSYLFVTARFICAKKGVSESNPTY